MTEAFKFIKLHIRRGVSRCLSAPAAAPAPESLVHFYKPEKWNRGQFAIASIPNDYWELFNRANDPGEMRDVFGDPAFANVRSNLLHELSRQRIEFKEPAHDDPKAYGRASEF